MVHALHLLALSSCGDRGWRPLWATFIISPVLLKSTLTSCLDHLPKISSPNIHTNWCLGLQHMSFGVDKCSVHTQHYHKEEMWEQMRWGILGVYLNLLIRVCDHPQRSTWSHLLVGNMVTIRVDPSYKFNSAPWGLQSTAKFNCSTWPYVTEHEGNRNLVRVKAYFYVL